MSDTVIRVENLGKRYIIGHQQQEKYTALRDVLANKAKGITNIFNPKSKIQNPKSEEFWALKDVSFEVKRGDRIGIIGRNGAGKSTLLKILSRITEPTEGRISLKGRVASLLEVGTGFHPELTGRENVYLNGAILGMSKQEIRRKFDEIVAFAEVEKFLDTPVKRYSSGMYVRLAFAVAAHLEPEILVVDEVLAVGDAAFQKKCLDKMERISESNGKTLFFVSHNLAAVTKLCNKGLILESGRIAYQGKSDDCLNIYLDSFGIETLSSGSAWENENISEKLAHDLVSAYCSQNKKTTGIMFDNHDVMIKIILRAHRHMSGIQIALILADERGEVLIHTQTDLEEAWNIPSGSGPYELAYRIPPYSLKPGSYHVSIFGLIPNITRLFSYENVLSFGVESRNPILMKYPNTAWRGMLSPNFGTWEMIVNN